MSGINGNVTPPPHCVLPPAQHVGKGLGTWDIESLGTPRNTDKSKHTEPKIITLLQTTQIMPCCVLVILDEREG